MARKFVIPALNARTARLKLGVRGKPYPARRSGAASSYSTGVTRQRQLGAEGIRWPRQIWTKAFAQADDFDESNGETILTFFEAQDRAKNWCAARTAAPTPHRSPWIAR